MPKNEIIPVILWAESADDPEGWIAKLNTYAKIANPNESLESAMKRVSSAYKTQSKQYKKALQNQFNDYELKVWNDLLNTVNNFIPDKNWQYIHHENYNLPIYEGMTESQIDNLLKKKWGKKVDFSKKVKIGKEFYFPEKTSHYRKE
jgi:hypothetical protein